MAAITAIICALIITGCSSSSGGSKKHADYTGPAPVMGLTVERASVAIGVLSTAAAKDYGYRVLSCPGADEDMRCVDDMAADAGITNRKMLLSQAATWAGVKAAILAATQGFGPEDLLVLSLAGHGGWVKDTNGDEVSGKDSTWCLYDGPVVDDDVWAFLVSQVPPCRVIFITDTCHSEGSWRQYVPFWDTSRNVDIDYRSQWPGSLVQLAACREAESALGGTLGGQWTSALYDTRNAATLRQWFDDAKSLVEDQVPSIGTYGPLAQIMLDGKPLE